MNTEPKVSSLTNLVNYQDDSVVSKILIKKETGNVTLFAFDKDQGLSEHMTPYDALVQVIEGKADIVLDGKSNITRAGEIIIMPANIPHALKAIEKFKMMLIMIRS